MVCQEGKGVVSGGGWLCYMHMFIFQEHQCTVKVGLGGAPRLQVHSTPQKSKPANFTNFSELVPGKVGGWEKKQPKG